VRAGEGGSGGRNRVEEKGKEGTQQGREGSKQEEEARGGKRRRKRLLRVQTQACTIQPLWMGRTHAA